MAPTPQGEARSPGARGEGNQARTAQWPLTGLSLPWQVGSFDPYSDDPRLGIQKIFLCKYSGYLAVAGTAGQVAGWAGWGRGQSGWVALHNREQDPLSGSNIESVPAASPQTPHPPTPTPGRRRMLDSP